MDNFIIKAFIAVIVIAIIFVIWQHFELRRFRITTYHVNAPAGLNIAVISDLHERQFDDENNALLEAVASIKPDIICIPGDLLTAHKSSEYERFTQGNVSRAVKHELELLTRLREIAPVYYSPGNHEARLKNTPGIRREIYEYYTAAMRDIGIHYLENESDIITIDNNKIAITGLDISLDYYTKFKSVHMDTRHVSDILGDRRADADYEILLAHSPDYFASYKAYGADLVFSGHMHGGLVRIPGIGAVVSPQLKLFPTYDAGRFDEDGSIMIVSKGLGTHTFNIRVFNRAELLNVVLENNYNV